MSDLTIDNIIDYVKSLCNIRQDIEEVKTEKTKEKIYIKDNNFSSFFDIFFSSICSYFSVLNNVDKRFYIEKYKDFFIADLKKKNNVVKYTTPSVIINKKKLMNDIKNVDSLYKDSVFCYDDIIVFLAVFFNINIFIIDSKETEENIYFYSSNFNFNVFKPSITIRHKDNHFSQIYFNSENIYFYNDNEKFKSFIDSEKTNIKTKKQSSNLDYVIEDFNIDYDNDVEIKEEIKEKIKLSNRRMKKYDKSESSEISESKPETLESSEQQEKTQTTESTEPTNLTEQIRQVMDVSYSEQELKNMTLVKLKELAKQNKIKQTNTETKKPKNKAELIKDLVEFYQS